MKKKIKIKITLLYLVLDSSVAMFKIAVASTATAHNAGSRYFEPCVAVAR